MNEHLCERCGSPTRIRTSTKKQPYHYGISGLNGVFLYGIKVETCDRCKLESPTIPAIGKLHALLTRRLLRTEGRLTGNQIRFLRKNAGLAAKEFAALLKITPEHMSLVENDKRQLGESTDLLARAIVGAAIGSSEVCEILLGHGETIEERLSDACFRFTNEWKGAA